MKLIRGIHNIRLYHHGCVLTIGNFDSVHRGHDCLLRRLEEKRQVFNSPAMVMIFEPQPLEFFLKKNAPTRLMNFRDKVKCLSRYKIDYILCIKFNHKFSLLTAESFVSSLLSKKLGIKCLIIGDDFHFGKNKTGNLYYLNEVKKQFGFELEVIKNFYDCKVRVSSTVIRKSLLSGNLNLAENLIGRPYQLSGRVVYGKKIGRMIGFPTANIISKFLAFPLNGVYAVEVFGLMKNLLFGVANIGTRPTVNGIRKILEIHLFNFDMNIYGVRIDVVFKKKLRNEHKFNSIHELKRQIKKDVILAKKFFDSYKNI